MNIRVCLKKPGERYLPMIHEEIKSKIPTVPDGECYARPPSQNLDWKVTQPHGRGAELVINCLDLMFSSENQR